MWNSRVFTGDSRSGPDLDLGDETVPFASVGNAVAVTAMSLGPLEHGDPSAKLDLELACRDLAGGIMQPFAHPPVGRTDGHLRALLPDIVRNDLAGVTEDELMESGGFGVAHLVSADMVEVLEPANLHHAHRFMENVISLSSFRGEVL